MPIKSWQSNYGYEIGINGRGQENHVRIWFISQIVIYGYNILNMTSMLILNFCTGFGLKLIYGGQKWALSPSFDQLINSTSDSLITGTG